jgi:hypothetical protein
MPMPPTDRLGLINALNGLPLVQFNALVFELKPPAGLMPPPMAPQGDRAFALVSWAESYGGCGLTRLQQVLQQILTHQTQPPSNNRNTTTTVTTATGTTEETPDTDPRTEQSILKGANVGGNLTTGDIHQTVNHQNSGTGGVNIGGNVSGNVITGDGNTFNIHPQSLPPIPIVAPVKKILILAANPKGTTQQNLGAEVREIQSGLERAKNRDQFILEQRWAVRPRDVQRSMLDTSPQIVHFLGRGAGEKGLVFEDDSGQAKLVDGKALAGLFKLFADKVECVVLNGCYSHLQAQSIVEHIPAVIGICSTISEQAAIEFAVGFYDALGAGRSVEFAFQLGCNAISLAGILEEHEPVLLMKHAPIEESRSST